MKLPVPNPPPPADSPASAGNNGSGGSPTSLHEFPGVAGVTSPPKLAFRTTFSDRSSTNWSGDRPSVSGRGSTVFNENRLSVNMNFKPAGRARDSGSWGPSRPRESGNNFGRMRDSQNGSAIREGSWRSQRSGVSERSSFAHSPNSSAAWRENSNRSSRSDPEGVPVGGTPVVFIDNILPDTDEHDFRAIFENNWGQVLRVNMQKDTNPWTAFVEFAKMDSIHDCVQASEDNSELLHQKDIGQMHVRYSNGGRAPGGRPSTTSPPRPSQRGRDFAANRPKNATSGIYVTRLPGEITEDMLYESFGVFGRVTDVFMIRDNDRGFRHSAFVDFIDVESATRAVEFRGMEIDGRRVDVKFKHMTEKPQNCFSVYVRNTPPATTEASVTACFKRFGKITGIQVLKDRSVAFVHFEKSEDVDAIVRLGRVKLHGEDVVVRYNTRDPRSVENPGIRASREHSEEARPVGCLKLYISHLSTETTEDSLRKVFSQFGTIERVFILRELSTGVSKGVAFIDYVEVGAADKVEEHFKEIKSINFYVFCFVKTIKIASVSFIFPKF